MADSRAVRLRTPLMGWLAWGLVSLFYLYEFLVRVAPSVMEPELQKSFHLSAAGLGAVLGAYYYIYAPLQIAVGGMLDRFGTRRILVPAILFCAAGCFLEILGGGASLLLVARLMQGAGSAFAFVGAMHAAARWFPPQKMAMMSGLTTALGMMGAIVGNAVVAEVVTDFGWQTSLRDAGIFGVAVAAGIFLFLPREREETASGESAAAAEGALPREGMLFLLRVVLTNPQTWIIGLVAGALYLPLSVFGGLWGVPYLSAVGGMSTVEASRWISVLYAAWLVGGPIAGILSDRLGKRKVMMVGAAALTMIGTVFLWLMPPTSAWGLGLLLLVIGLTSSVQVVGFAAGLEANPPAATATSIASINMIVMLLGGLLQPAVGWLLDISSSPAMADSGQFSAGQFQLAMLMLPGACAIAFVLTFFMKETFRQPIPDEEPYPEEPA